MTAVKVLLLLSFLGLAACIHVEDIDQPPQEAPNLYATNIGNIIVDTEIYIFNGEILNKEAYEKLQSLPRPLTPDNEDKETVEIAFQSLTLKKGGVIYTMGERVRLKVHHLISEGGSIATFPKDQTAAPQENGRSGGFVYLHLDKAEGELFISLRGENGGIGKPGAEPDQSLRGKDGIAVFGRCGEDAYVTEGKKGLQGYPGGQGMNGGDSGNFELQISDQNKFKYRLEKVPGQGGIGGEGGRGGEGGITPNLCGMGRAPIEGDRGKRGVKGKDGGIGSLCLTSYGTTSCI